MTKNAPRRTLVSSVRAVNKLTMQTSRFNGRRAKENPKSLVSKTQADEWLHVIFFCKPNYNSFQSLLMVFIQLIRYQLEMTLEFLSLVPGPTGKAALEYILTEWCSKQNSFYGAYERKARYVYGTVDCK